MAIAKKPKRNLTEVVKSDPMAFIQGAHQGEPIEIEPARRKRKEPVIIRFDDVTLKRVDRAAARRGLSRAALVRMLVIEHLWAKLRELARLLREQCEALKRIG